MVNVASGASMCDRVRSVWPDRAALDAVWPYSQSRDGVDRGGILVPDPSPGPVFVTSAEMTAAREQCYGAQPTQSESGAWLGRVELQGGRLQFRPDIEAGQQRDPWVIVGPRAAEMRAALIPAGQVMGAAPDPDRPGHPLLLWVSGEVRLPPPWPGEIRVDGWERAETDPFSLGGKDFDGLTDREQEMLYQSVLEGAVLDPELVMDYDAAQRERERIALEYEGVSDPSQLSARTRELLAKSAREVADWQGFCQALRARGYDCEKLKTIAGVSWNDRPGEFVELLEDGGPDGSWGPLRDAARIDPAGTGGRGWLVAGGLLALLALGRRRR